jgi:hypothetical protein
MPLDIARRTDWPQLMAFLVRFKQKCYELPEMVASLIEKLFKPSLQGTLNTFWMSD